jgi:hypothetical protein
LLKGGQGYLKGGDGFLKGGERFLKGGEGFLKGGEGFLLPAVDQWPEKNTDSPFGAPVQAIVKLSE